MFGVCFVRCMLIEDGLDTEEANTSHPNPVRLIFQFRLCQLERGERPLWIDQKLKRPSNSTMNPEVRQESLSKPS
jgi:hypothetical protein